MHDAFALYRDVIDTLVVECQAGQGPIAARGDAEAAFVSGVHTALRVLHEAGLPPFEDGYEGTPFHDFVGRLQGWQWPPDVSKRNGE